MTKRLALLLVCLGLFGSSHAAAKSLDRVVLRDNVPAAHRDELVNKLRKITGWTRLTFNHDGTLSLISPDISNGSKSARSLLSRAVAGQDVIVLEDASNRADVAFCRIVPGRWINGNSSRPAAYVVLIDFTDFEQIVGDDEAREAFDVGWGLLHELDHVVTNSEDSNDYQVVGDCEAHINQMRKELGLPLRANYFFTTLKADPNFNTRLVRLPFEHRDPLSRRMKRYWLAWDAALVGGLSLPPKRLARSSADIF